jgi:hypothetical protein
VNVLAVYWTVPSSEDFPRETWEKPLALIVGPYAGPAEEGESVTKPLHSLGTPFVDLSGVMPYVTAQKVLFDADYPDGQRYYWKSTYLRELSGEAIAIMADMTLKRPSLLSSIDIWRLGGALERVPLEETPISHRAAPYLIGVEANWEATADDHANISWTRETVDRLAPFSTGGSYLNFEDLSDAKATAASHGANFQRLVEIKKKYDPGNLFRSRRGLVD